MKLYTENQLRNAIAMGYDWCYQKHIPSDDMIDTFIEHLSPIVLPSDEEIEEKLEVAFGNGYEQGEMDFYKKMKGQGNEYADGYAEGYKRALDYMTDTLKNKIEIQGGNK